MKNNKIVLLTLLGLLASGQSFGYDPLIDDLESSYDSEQIDVDGTFEQKKGPSAADRIEKMRRKLEEKNEQMVEKKIEDMRIKEELKLTKKLQKAFTGQPLLEDTVTEVKAQAKPAPAPAPAPVVIVKKAKPKFFNNKVVPTFSFSNLTTDRNDWSTDINFKLGFENNVSDRLAVSIEVGYKTLSAHDVRAIYTQYNGFNYNSNRSYDYTGLGAGIGAKLYFNSPAKLRPYVNAAVGYERMTVKFNNGDSYYNNFGNLSESKVTKGLFNGRLGIGVELNISPVVGLVAEASYAANFNNEDFVRNASWNVHQSNLEFVGNEIVGAETISGSVGMLVRF